jgi:hypothetical protein
MNIILLVRILGTNTQYVNIVFGIQNFEQIISSEFTCLLGKQLLRRGLATGSCQGSFYLHLLCEIFMLWQVLHRCSLFAIATIDLLRVFVFKVLC